MATDTFITKNDVPEATAPLSFMQVAARVESEQEFLLPWRGSGNLWLKVVITDASMSHGRWDVVVTPANDSNSANPSCGGTARVYLTSLRTCEDDEAMPWE